MAIRLLMLSVALSVAQVCAVSDDQFWDGQFGIPGVPYEEGVVSAMLALGNDLYVGGTFTSIGGLATTSIARWDGTNWHALGSGIDGGVFQLVQSRGELVAAGHFLTAGGAPARYVAKWDGEEWSEVGGGVNGTVFALATDGSDVYAGGHFTETGGVPASKVARWDGEKWSALGAGIIPVYEPNDWVGAVGSLAVNGRDVFVGGTFRNAGGIAATNIARWDGTNWHALGNGLRYFDGPGSENGGVGALAVQNGVLFAGGSFWRAGDVAATNIARCDGEVWSEVGSGVNDRLVVQSMFADDTGVYVGGAFRQIGGVGAERLAEWDGMNWQPVGSGIGVGGLGGGIIAMTSTGTELYVGGLFTTAGDKPSTNIALWHIPHSLTIDSESDAVRLRWPATGTNFTLETKDSLRATTSIARKFACGPREFSREVG